MKMQESKKYEELKVKLVTQIQKSEAEMNQKMQEMQQRLANREKELASVKQLFIEKLRLLESSFADLGEVLPQIQKDQ